MSLNKAIAHGQEHRKPKYKALKAARNRCKQTYKPDQYMKKGTAQSRRLKVSADDQLLDWMSNGRAFDDAKYTPIDWRSTLQSAKGDQLFFLNTESFGMPLCQKEGWIRTDIGLMSPELADAYYHYTGKSVLNTYAYDDSPRYFNPLSAKGLMEALPKEPSGARPSINTKGGWPKGRWITCPRITEDAIYGMHFTERKMRMYDLHGICPYCGVIHEEVSK